MAFSRNSKFCRIIMQLSALVRRKTLYLTRHFCPGWKYMSNFYWLITTLSLITWLLGLVQVTKLGPFLLHLDYRLERCECLILDRWLFTDSEVVQLCVVRTGFKWRWRQDKKKRLIIEEKEHRVIFQYLNQKLVFISIQSLWTIRRKISRYLWLFDSSEVVELLL